MILLTDELRDQLLANGRQRDTDHVPVVKFFNPLGEGVWLATELDEDGDTLFGLADLGHPELGCFSFEEMSSLRLPFDMRIERDILFTGDFPISVWAERRGRLAASARRSASFIRRPVTAAQAAQAVPCQNSSWPEKLTGRRHALYLCAQPCLSTRTRRCRRRWRRRSRMPRGIRRRRDGCGGMATRWRGHSAGCPRLPDRQRYEDRPASLAPRST